MPFLRQRLLSQPLFVTVGTFEAYFEHYSFVYLDQCVAELNLRGEWMICMLLAISFVDIGKRPTQLNYAHAILMLSTRVEYFCLSTYLDSCQLCLFEY